MCCFEEKKKRVDISVTQVTKQALHGVKKYEAVVDEIPIPEICLKIFLHDIPLSQDSLLPVLRGVQLSQLVSVFRLDPGPQVLHQRHDGASAVVVAATAVQLRHRQLVPLGEREEERKDLGGNHLLRHAPLVTAQRHLVHTCRYLADGACLRVKGTGRKD